MNETFATFNTLCSHSFSPSLTICFGILIDHNLSILVFIDLHGYKFIIDPNLLSFGAYLVESGVGEGRGWGAGVDMALIAGMAPGTCNFFSKSQKGYS